MYVPHFIYPFICWWTFGLPLVMNTVAMNVCAQVFMDLLFVVSEKLTFVERDEVAERPVMASRIGLSLMVEVGSLWLGRHSAPTTGDYQGGIMWWDTHN